MHAELREDGHRVNHKRVGRLMHLGGVRGVTRPVKWRTTTRDKEARPAPNLVERNFTAAGPRSARGRGHHVHSHQGRLLVPRGSP
jgi:putative transposase